MIILEKRKLEVHVGRGCETATNLLDLHHGVNLSFSSGGKCPHWIKP